MTAGKIGPYLIERQLGQGGMGAVFEVVHPGLGARYAVKAFLSAGASMDAGQRARFQREIETLAAVQHPNLVRIHSSGEDQGRPYFVMDLVEGEDLHRRLQRAGALPPREAVAAVRDVARAVAALHAAGIAHRDIKPGNVIVAEGRAVLMDLGVARYAHDARTRLTVTGELVGTPAYMAPEQALGLPDTTPAVDVWSLGMLLYALLAGRHAIRPGANALATLQQVAQGQVVPLLESAPDVPRELAVLVARALRRDPADRPSAAAWAEALDAWLRGEAGQELPVPVGRARRRAGWVAFLLVAAVAGLVGRGLVTHGPRELPLRERAERALQAGLAALGSAAVAPLGSTGLGELGPALRAGAEAAPPAEARELRGLLGCLLVLEAEGALRRGAPEEAAAALAAAPPESDVARAQLDLYRALRAALQAGLPGEAAPAAGALEAACERWPEWLGLRARSARRALAGGDPRRALGDALALLAAPAADPQALALAAEVACGADAWQALGAHEARLPARHVAWLHARRALAHLPGQPAAAASELRGAQLELLEAQDPLRVKLAGELGRIVAAARGTTGGPESVDVRTREGWAHVALHALDPAYQLPRARQDPMWALGPNAGFQPERYDREILQLMLALVPLHHGADRVRFLTLIMQGAVGVWSHLEAGDQRQALDMAREGYRYTRQLGPEGLIAIADMFSILLVRSLDPLDELPALVEDAASALPEGDAREAMRARMIRRQGELHMERKQPALALPFFDQALELDPRSYEVRLFRIRLRVNLWKLTRGVDVREAALADIYTWLSDAPRPSRGLSPEWEGMVRNAAMLEREAGRPERACTALERATSAWPGFALVAAELLWTRLGLGALEPAAVRAALDDLGGRIERDEQALRSTYPANARDEHLGWLAGLRDALGAVRARVEAGDLEGARARLLAGLPEAIRLSLR